MKVDFDLYNLLISRLLKQDDLTFIKDIIKNSETQQVPKSTEQIVKNKQTLPEKEHKEQEFQSGE